MDCSRVRSDGTPWVREPNTLTEQQSAFLEWLVDPNPQKGSQANFAKSIGVAAGTLSKWKQDKFFIEAWEKRCADINVMPDRIQAVVNSIWKRACEGDARAAQLYLEYVEKFTPKKKIEVEDKSVKEMTDEELAEELQENITHLRSVGE